MCTNPTHRNIPTLYAVHSILNNRATTWALIYHSSPALSFRCHVRSQVLLASLILHAMTFSRMIRLARAYSSPYRLAMVFVSKDGLGGLHTVSTYSRTSLLHPPQHTVQSWSLLSVVFVGLQCRITFELQESNRHWRFAINRNACLWCSSHVDLAIFAGSG